MSGSQLPSGQIVYDPRGTVTTETQPSAERLVSLNGIRLGVLDNSKWNAGKLLRHTVSLLEREASLVVVHFYKKDSFSRPASPDLIDRITSETDAVVTAIGD